MKQKTSLLWLFCTALIMSFIFYGLEPGNTLTYSPWHHDDYRELLTNENWTDFNVARPVTQTAYRLIAKGGPLLFYLSLHVLLAVDLVLMCLLALEVFGPERLSLGMKTSVVVFGTIVACSSPDLSSIVKYTGNIDHLLSLFFGILSVLLLARSCRRSSVGLLLFSGLLFTFSILAKEDTVLFLGVAALLIGVPALRSERPKSYKVGLVCVGLLSLGIIGFLLHPASGNPWYMVKLTLMAGSQSYGVHATANELAAVLRYLIAPSAYYILVHLGFIVAAVLHVGVTRRISALSAALLVVSLLAPYALLGSEHAYPYYRLNFSPFAVYCAFAMGAEVVRWLLKDSRIATGVWAAACLGAAGILFWYGRPERRAVEAWHNNLQMISRKVLNGIEELKPALKASREVHVVGVDRVINPFFWLDGPYYLNQEILEGPVKWVIHYKPDSELERVLASLKVGNDPVVLYVASDLADSEPLRPRIEVDASFNTRFIPASP